MSGHGGGGSGIGNVIWMVILVVVALFIIWYYTGGPERANTENPFLKPPPAIDSGETYGPGSPTNY